jgi:hypothetical protein
MVSNPMVVQSYPMVYFFDLRVFLTLIIILLAFRKPHAGVERMTLRRMADLQDWGTVPLVALETSGRNRSEGPVLSFHRHMGDGCSTYLGSSHFSLF